MTIQVLMPALSPTMEVGTLAKWLVAEGDLVRSGDLMAEIETDKATMEVEAVDEGRIGKILVPEGTENVPVNMCIAILLEEGETEADLQIPEDSERKVLSASGASLHEGAAPAVEQPVSSGASVSGSVESSGSAKRTEESLDSSVEKKEEGRLFASPLARRVAREKNIDLYGLQGSGPRGRIILRDVEAALAGGAVPISEQKVVSVKGMESAGDQALKALYAEGSYEELPHSGMRKTIAKRLTESKQTVPHFYLSADCQLDSLLALREDLNASAPVGESGAPAYKLSVNDFVVKALGVALREVPMANATWTEGSRLLHKHADVGVAVAVPDGLFTPVIRKVESQSLSSVSAQIKDLAERARAKKLTPEQYQGGSTAVSNLGMYGVKDFKAIISPPHGTILAVGAADSRPVVRDGAVVVAKVMSVTLSCDHRVVDGVLGAELLRAFKALVENPMRLLV